MRFLTFLWPETVAISSPFCQKHTRGIRLHTRVHAGSSLLLPFYYYIGSLFYLCALFSFIYLIHHEPFSHTMAVSSTIYQRCRSVLDGLAAVPGCASFGIQRLSETNISDGSKAEMNDDYIPRPFYHLWKLCRDGAILNHLCNLLEPQHAIDVQSCKKHKKPVYRFIIVCQNHLNLREDELFTVSEMYKDNTNTFVKVRLIHHHHIKRRTLFP